MSGFGWESRVLIVVVTLAAIGNLVGTHAFCSASALKAYAAGDASSCWEFWLNRYQTLAGALVAVIAAASAWVGLQKGIEVSQKQLAASAVEHLDRRRTALYQTRVDLGNSEDAIRQRVYNELGDAYFDQLCSIDTLSDLPRSILIRNNEDKIRQISYQLINNAIAINQTTLALQNGYESRIMTTKCRDSLAKQYWRANSMLGIGHFVVEFLINVNADLESKSLIDANLAELKRWCGIAQVRMGERQYAECQQIIDAEIALVLDLIDKTLAQLENV